MAKAKATPKKRETPSTRLRYGARSTISPAQSRADIEEMLSAHGATGFGYRSEPGAAVLSFVLGNEPCEYRLPLPAESEFYFYADGRKRPAKDVIARHEEATRQRWRAAVLVVRARLEAFACGIESFSDAFRPKALLAMRATAETDMVPTAPELAAKPVAVRVPRTRKNRTTLVARPKGTPALSVFA